MGITFIQVEVEYVKIKVKKNNKKIHNQIIKK